jgi:WXG100 family type VII secretion target
MTAYDVDLDELRSAVQQLAACQRDLLSLAGEIEQAHAGLQLSWSGQSGRAEESSYAAWRTGCANMVTALAALRAVAEAADEHYAGAVAANVARWAAVAP